MSDSPNRDGPLIPLHLLSLLLPGRHMLPALFLTKEEMDMTDKGITKTRKLRLTRRRFVKSAGAAATVVTTGFGVTSLADQPLQKVEEDDPMAKALHYLHDAGSVDAAKRASDRYCNNCVLYQGGVADEWAPCSIFPGKVVAGRGWCSAWAPKSD